MAATWTTSGGRSTVSVQAATETKPADGDADGVNVWGVGAFRLVFECDAGQTFTAATGGFDGYSADDVGTIWARHDEIDIDVPASAVGQRAFAVSFTVAHPWGRIAHIANAAPVSGGGVTVRYECTEINGRKV